MSLGIVDSLKLQPCKTIPANTSSSSFWEQMSDKWFHQAWYVLPNETYIIICVKETKLKCDRDSIPFEDTRKSHICICSKRQQVYRKSQMS